MWGDNMKILDEHSYTDFTKYSKEYNVNVEKHSRMVHKKAGCYYSKPYRFIPFDSLEEIKKFEKEYNIQFTYCQNPKCGFKK